MSSIWRHRDGDSQRRLTTAVVSKRRLEIADDLGLIDVATVRYMSASFRERERCLKAGYRTLDGVKTIALAEKLVRIGTVVLQ